MKQRYFGIDIGAETVKAVVIERAENKPDIISRYRREHGKDPYGVFLRLLEELNWDNSCPISATGRLSRGLNCLRVPVKAALTRGVRYAHPEHIPGTVVSIGSQGFSVLELRKNSKTGYRENSRCSQGTGNFLCQLVERFGFGIAEAGRICSEVEKPVLLSGRCPVILKTDMTHLANKGEDTAAILAGLYDAVCENVQVLIKPGSTPPDVILTGGVVIAPRVKHNFKEFLKARDMRLADTPPESLHYLEALGAALVAQEQKAFIKDKDSLIGSKKSRKFEKLPPLKDALHRVRRISLPPEENPDVPRTAVLGFDIGSTGSKAAALDVSTGKPFWESYLETKGNPVSAAQKLVQSFIDETTEKNKIRSIGVTGSGREIVGSLMANCFGTDAVVIMNEIAAHARGAGFYDNMVDTIFEIGGQDAKYTRLEDGNITDAAMNEACSAGTGSFIAEQGTRFEGVTDVQDMNRMAMDAEYGVSLGQHCSVFMAEVIADAAAENIPQDAVIAGLYDSIAQNYLNRVKGSRTVGERIFCQGMPFKSDALAAAIARQTGKDVIIPPNPGTTGALGIGLITMDRDIPSGNDIDLSHFLTAKVLEKSTFICRSNKGCGGKGNKCRIDCIKTRVRGRDNKFMWGGNCSLYDNGARKRKLPDLAPDPFSERKALIENILSRPTGTPESLTVAVVEEFSLKSLLPFFLTFFHRLGFKVRVFTDEGMPTLKHGINVSNVPFCAPMQIFQGIVSKIIKTESPDFLFVPRVRELPRHGRELHGVTCPIVQASPDIVSSEDTATHVLTSRIDMGPGNLDSERFTACVRAIAKELGKEKKWKDAWGDACLEQRAFDRACLDLGRRAIEFAEQNGLAQIIVLGRTYTIHNSILNSNVPNILREQGSVAIPVDCYPLDQSTPVFTDIYWGSAQTCLRAAHQIRRTEHQYAVYCSNYSCGPDSFILHFFSHIMENKPFTIIETDGHSGDAGTKTRIEAFLYCVYGDMNNAETEGSEADQAKINEFGIKERNPPTIIDAREKGELLLIPRMGPCAETIAALLCADGGRSEAVPPATPEAIRMARRYTSGKECLPFAITLGSLLTRLEEDRKGKEKFAYLMPRANGPCRFGMYNILQKIILEKNEWAGRVRLISPSDEDYFLQVPRDFQLRAFSCFTATDMLQAALHDVRPVEKEPGLAQSIYDRCINEQKQLMLTASSRHIISAMGSVFGNIFGLLDLLKRAGREFREAKDFKGAVPRVSVVGEIYVRLDSFANGNIIKELEDRGVGCTLAPFSEWLMYTTVNELQRFDENRAVPGDNRKGALMNRFIQNQVVRRLYNAIGKPLGWSPPAGVEEIINRARPYISPELFGEAVLSLGSPALEFYHGHIDGVVAVGPHECMPNKIVESQFFHLENKTGLNTLAVAVNGEPVDPEILDRFAFEVHEHYAEKTKHI